VVGVTGLTIALLSIFVSNCHGDWWIGEDQHHRERREGSRSEGSGKERIDDTWEGSHCMSRSTRGGCERDEEVEKSGDNMGFVRRQSCGGVKKWDKK
jgi:hypothetical protein